MQQYFRQRIRNRIVGAIATAFGLCLLLVLISDGQWGNHESEKPVKALMGSVFFIGIGLWYMIKGPDAQPWVKADKGKKLEQRGTHSVFSKVNLLALAEREQRNNPAFAEQCKEMNQQLRKHAEKLEKQRQN